jgi:formamidopyrimidine-DNA glycosylase
MPELPEVETIRRGLESKVRGRVIERVEVRLAKQVRGMSPAAFSRRLAGQRISGLGRRGKYLLFRLSSGALAIHLGMSGQVTFWDHRRRDTPGFLVHRHTGLQKTAGQHAPDRHTHVLLHLKGGDRVQYRDIRQFGHLRFLDDPEAFPPFQRLGLEPLGSGWRREDFFGRLKAHRGGIKARLLAQQTVAGLGNIYADEALHLAGIHPLQRTERMGSQKMEALFQAIPRVLEKGLANGGTTLMDFRGAGGEPGSNQESLRAYGRAGEPCLNCGTAMKKILVAQRTTVFCPNCQTKK